MRHTKILETLGPATEEKSEIRALVQAGMDIVRLNFSHGTFDQFKKIVKNIRAVEKETGKTVAILQDLQGPKIRLGDLPEGQISVSRGDIVTFSTAARSAVLNKEKNTIPPIIINTIKTPSNIPANSLRLNGVFFGILLFFNWYSTTFIFLNPPDIILDSSFP